MDHACLPSAQSDGLPLRGGVVAQGLVEEGSWDEKQLWNASEYPQGEPENWTFQALNDDSSMGDIGDAQGAADSKQPSCSILVELDLNTVAPEENGGDFEAETLVPAPASAEDAHVQGSTAAVSTPTKASSVEDGNISTPCPSVQEDGARQPSADIPALSFPLPSDSTPDGAVAQGPALHLEVLPQVDGSQRGGPSFPGSFLSSWNTGGGNNSPIWLRTPQGRGKALVRRGRPRPLSAETREEVVCKRMRIHELFSCASASTAQTVVNAPPPFSSESAFAQVEVEKPNTPVLEAALLAAVVTSGEEQRQSPATTTEQSAVATTEQAPVTTTEQAPVTITEQLVDCKTEIPVKAPVDCKIEIPVNAPVDYKIEIPDKASGRKQCKGTTLAKTQCAHHVKDGSDFCMKHTAKTAADRGSSSGVPYYKHPDAVVFRCRGLTLHNNQCARNAKAGDVYCEKHGEQGNGPPKRIEDGIACPSEVPPPTPTQVHVQEQAPSSSPSSPHADDEGDGARCAGRTRRSEAPCVFKARSGSMFCERHARQVREKAIYDTAYEAPPLSSPSSASLSLRQRRSLEVTLERSLSKAKEVLSNVLNAGLFRGRVISKVGRDIIQMACEEASKDALSGEMLLGLLAEERTRLHKSLIEDRKNLAVVKPPHYWQKKYSPDVPRLHLEIADTPKVCSKGDRNDALQRNLSGRFSSDAHGASGSGSSSAQMAGQRSEAARDVFTCGLCMTKFPEMPSLGKHWRQDHKKEAFLFQKGMACPECAHEYTNKGGLQRHWKSAHPALPTTDFPVVCMMCNARFPDFDLLWMHVEAQHCLEFSSAEFAQQVRNGVLGAMIEDQNESSSGPDTKYMCKFCGQRFSLLPDLGRHHQAEHKTRPKKKAPRAIVKRPPRVNRTPFPRLEAVASSPGKTLPLADVFASQPSVSQDDPRNSVEWPDPNAHPQALNFRHLKTIAREKKNREEQIMNAASAQLPVPPPASQPGPVIATQGLAPQGDTPHGVAFQMAAPYEIAPKKRRRRRKKIESLPNVMLAPGPVPMKKRLGRPLKRLVEPMGAIQQERYGVSKMPLQRATNTIPSSAEKVLNTTGWPTSAEILDAARVACCKESWYRELGKKHSYVHPNLHLQAMSLFAVMRPDIQWLVDTFRCPNECLPYHVVHAPAPAPPGPGAALEVDMAGFSEAPFKAEADHITGTGSRPAPRAAAPEAVDIDFSMRTKVYVMNMDLSNGQEPVPIPCVIDEELLTPCSCPQCVENMKHPSLDTSEPWKCFRYTNRRLLDPSLGLDTESSKLGCACGEGKCDPSKCDHVVMFDLDNEDALDKSGVAMKGRFPYDEQGRIILEEGRLVYECNSSCFCHEDCQNRVLQKGVRVKLEVFKTRHKGWAVRAAEPIRSGTFVCEYIGEVIDDGEAHQRGVRYDSYGCSYLYDIDAHLDLVVSRAGAKPFVIDASKHGNVARFINHSCAPNLINYEVLVESMDCQLAHIGFFAHRDIAAGEELSYDYRYQLLPGKGVTCHCGALACRGRLY